MEYSSEIQNHNEDIIIENRYKVTKELYKKWSKENKATVFFQIFWLLVALYCIGMTVFCIILNDLQDGVIFIIFAIALFLRVFKNSRRYDVIAKTYKKNNWERRILFYDDYIETSDENISICRFQYSDIVNMEKNDECIKLKMGIGRAYIRVYKDAFVKSNFEECEQFLDLKMNNYLLE